MVVGQLFKTVFLSVLIISLFGFTTGFRVTCGAGKHPCANNASCISLDYVCDGSYDCSDRSDEKDCEEGRDCKIKACSHFCEKGFNSAKCLCLKGYTLDTDERTCIDDDKCQNRNLCSHICVNTPGSYRCECRSGYVLDDDGSCLLNGTEERPLEEKISCLVGKFPCENGASCIPESFLCDGSNDCADGSDETGCENGADCKKERCEQGCILEEVTVLTCLQALNPFPCENGLKCIPLSYVCDHENDCGDNSDQASCQTHNREWILSEAKKKHLIGHNFTEEDCSARVGNGNLEKRSCKKARCVCNEGYAIGNSGKCYDINECADNPCSQFCQNIPGSYSCSCSKGYRLEWDGVSCKASGGHPVLVMTTYKRTSLSILGTNRVYNFSGSNDNTILKSLFHGLTSELITLETFVNGGIIKRTFSNGTKSISTPLSPIFKSPEGLALDWLNSKLYLTDPAQGIISACTMDLDHSLCSNIFLNPSSSPVAIVLDVLKGTLYWSDWGTNPGIYKGAMDGQGGLDQIPVVRNEVSRINDLAIHHVTGVLYWCDLDAAGISYVELTDEQTSLWPSQIDGITDVVTTLTVFEDQIYYVIKDSSFIQILNYKTNGIKEFYDMKEPVVYISIYHPVLVQNDSHHNPCDENTCSHLCLLSRNQSHSCTCYNGYKLQPDGENCADEELNVENVSELNNLTSLLNL